VTNATGEHCSPADQNVFIQLRTIHKTQAGALSALLSTNQDRTIGLVPGSLLDGPTTRNRRYVVEIVPETAIGLLPLTEN
jgi:hypothetical protein